MTAAASSIRRQGSVRRWTLATTTSRKSSGTSSTPALSSSSTKNGLPPVRADVVSTWARFGRWPRSPAMSASSSSPSRPASSRRSTRSSRMQLGHQLPQRVLIAEFVGAVAGDYQHRVADDVAAQVVEQAEGERVGPVDVLEHHDQRSRAAQLHESSSDDLVDQRLCYLRVPGPSEACRVSTLPRTQASGCDVGPGRRHANCFHGGSQSLHFGPARELALQIPQKTHHRCVGQGTSLSRHAGADSGQIAQALRPGARFADQPGLADSRLATDEDRGPRRLTNGFEAGCELGELRLPSDQFERSEPAHHAEIVALSAFECLGSSAGSGPAVEDPPALPPKGSFSTLPTGSDPLAGRSRSSNPAPASSLPGRCPGPGWN